MEGTPRGRRHGACLDKVTNLIEGVSGTPITYHKQGRMEEITNGSWPGGHKKTSQNRGQWSHALKGHYISLGRDEGRIFQGGRSTANRFILGK